MPLVLSWCMDGSDSLGYLSCMVWACPEGWIDGIGDGWVLCICFFYFLLSGRLTPKTTFHVSAVLSTVGRVSGPAIAMMRDVIELASHRTLLLLAAHTGPISVPAKQYKVSMKLRH